jgi:ABC-type transport system involved in multi-copper enzyme maturation permease subunit
MTRATPSFAASALRVFDLSLGQMLWSRRTIFMALVVGGPVLIALVVRVLVAIGVGTIRIDGTPMAGATVFGMMIWIFYLRFTVPVLSVFYGTALIADEVEDKTITYLFTRPVSRGAVLVGKYLAYLACTSLVVLPSVMLVYFLIVPRAGGSLARSFPALLTDLGLLALGLAVYGALFAWIGAQLKRPLLTGLIFLFGWEPAVLVFPGYLRRFTVAYYLQALVPHAMPQNGAVSMIQSITSFQEAPSLAGSLFWLLLLWLGFLTLATRSVERREYVLEQ